MTKAEFKQAFAIADSKVDLSNVDDTVLDGCGLPDFQPVAVTLEAVAKHLRWQARYLNGQWDSEALDECHAILRRKAQIVQTVV
jgi:hypothetical protein